MIIRFPIGDWSDDGHGKCEWYTVQTDDNVTLQQVREAHYKATRVLGFPIGSICKLYQDDRFTDQQIEKLKELDYDFEQYVDHPDQLCGTPEIVLDVWLFLLNKMDRNLELVCILDDVPTINFYGMDSKGRHVDTPGYGCFE